MANIDVTVTGEGLFGENPLELKSEDTQVTWTFKDSQGSNLGGFRVKFVAFLPEDNHFPTTRVSPFTTDTISSGAVANLDVNVPAGLYIYVVLDDQGNLLKWSDEVFSVGTTFHGKFGTVIPPAGPPNTGPRTNTGSASS